MTFDKNKVYTALNADEVKVGSFGFCADSLDHLKMHFHDGVLDEIDQIGPDYYEKRFGVNNYFYPLFYLVEEPKEEYYRPYENIDEMVENFKKRVCGFDYEPSSWFMPTIWIKEKNSGDKYLITGFIKDDSNTYCVLIGTCFVSLEVLFKSYTYLDGTPCGKQIWGSNVVTDLPNAT